MSIATAAAFDMAEPIPGYRTQERIGAGGYGEVWRAEAPGGIAKAVKVVYGYRDDERARRELSALNRIKEVRHPFLLSLERIELVDGHLVIVAELATSSLKHLFEQYRQSGTAGIPRGELLAHLRDAAEALDYICREHSLQHLDIKPENLLLVGGRVKVADFGQVKDLQDVNSSIVSGLTPVYAAPELFDGRPNNHSDQYSLAIVYQEMLTGVLPFEGRTTAQLAAQHLHSRPRLDPLPASDQATIARALAKNPAERFSTCCDMIDSLLEVTPNHRFRAGRTAAVTRSYCPASAVPAAPVATEVLPGLGVPPPMPVAEAADVSVTQLPEAVPAPRDLPPLEIRPEDVAYRPTVFVGIGGLAARTLQLLHQRLAQRFGDLSSVPALQVLLLDTDTETLQQVTQPDSPDSLPDEAALLLPLRQAADYRREPSDRLQWLSRRWIYNIPRSGQTQGFRPLGRLALVDHFERVQERLTRAIRAAADPQGLAISAENTGVAFQGPPRVFLVSSITGGTGSGMVLDVAYLARKILRDLGLADDGVCGVLAHCSGHSQQARDLGVANAYAFLGELHQYSDPQYAYPGAPACGLPGFAPEEAPFRHAYVVHLGEDLGPNDFAAAVSTLTKYLYCSAVTSAGVFFDKCREESENQPAGGDPAVRTFGLSQLGFSQNDVPAAAAAELCKTLVTRWRGIDCADAEEDQPASLADPTSLLATQFAAGVSEEGLRAEVLRRSQEAGLDLDSIVEQLEAVAAGEMGADADSYLVTVLGELIHNVGAGGRSADRLASNQSVLEALSALIRSAGIAEGRRVCLESLLEKHLKEMAAARAAPLCDWILGLGTSPAHRVGGAQRAAYHVAEHLRAISRQAGEAMQAAGAELATLEKSLLADEKGSRAWLQSRGFYRRRLMPDKRVARYFRLRIEELTRHAASRLAGLVLAQVVALEDRLRNLAADLNRLAAEFAGQATPGGGERPAAAPDATRRLVADTVHQHKAELVAELDRDLADDLRRAVELGENHVRGTLSRLLPRAARAAIVRALKKINLREIAAALEGDSRERVFSLEAGLKAATPRLGQCGGARRLLLITPHTFSTEQLREQLREAVEEPPTVVADADESVLLCYEAEQLPLRRVAAAVLDRRFQNVELTNRLYTRTDVPWAPL